MGSGIRKKSGTAAAAGTARTRVRRSPAAMATLKREMLERARRICRDEGAAGLSMRRMAQEFGLSTMALYSYFPNKQALLEGLWLEVFEALLERLLPVSAGRRAPLKVLEAHARGLIGFWEERADQFRMIYMSLQQTAGGDAVAMAEQPAYQKLVHLTRERVAACARGAAEPSEETLSLLAAQMVSKQLGYLLLALGVARYPLRDRDALRERVVQDIVAGVVAGLG
ncbi:TetR/AcrR family transcriptional regulator [Roseateles sp. DAIF2]|uniref:TetR/AcrR family transcriptional regulator n=1 Tax=Roseateles sp. DAIF2 TaxID=2714952 RepID=UPI0018A2DD1F|nr:TetR/AcrR family transcriptional regulator [Roseateles sp. DAIF2]QPF72829.1 TetR/AcrR family transcriptional regulator [Roseateles sp. DAIF2]